MFLKIDFTLKILKIKYRFDSIKIKGTHFFHFVS